MKSTLEFLLVPLNGILVGSQMATFSPVPATMKQCQKMAKMSFAMINLIIMTPSASIKASLTLP